MNPGSRSWLSNAWLVTGTSAAAIVLLIVLLWSPWDRWSSAETRPLRLYCSAGMIKPVSELLAAYEKEYGVRVHVSYDGSGTLLSTIRGVGGRGDLYLASEDTNIQTARKEGLIAEVIPVAQLRPVLVVSEKTQQTLQKAGKPITSLKELVRDDVKVVLANPDMASIGRFSERVLEKAGLWKTIQRRMTESAARVSTVGTVNEVAQVVRVRDHFVGIVWSATAKQTEGLHIVSVPEMADLVEPLQLAVLARSQEPTAALRLARFLSAADRGGEVFKKHHFEPYADADLWDENPTIHLSAGAMLVPGIDEIVKNFSRREGVTIKTTYAGCGLLVGQMKAIKTGQGSGHFPDAYFACDQSFLVDVQPWFEAGTLVTKNDIVLVVPKGNPGKVQALADLARDDLRVGLAHPKNSALGKLTDDLLVTLMLRDDVYHVNRAKPVVHADAAHLLVNQMRAGALDVAVVYRSNVLSSPANREHLDIVEIGLAEAVALQPFAVAKDSPHKHLVRRLLQAVTTPESTRRFQRLGFHTPDRAP